MPVQEEEVGKDEEQDRYAAKESWPSLVHLIAPSAPDRP